jgi:hypothetical protein
MRLMLTLCSMGVSPMSDKIKHGRDAHATIFRSTKNVFLGGEPGRPRPGSEETCNNYHCASSNGLDALSFGFGN